VLLLCQSDALWCKVIYCLAGAGAEIHVFSDRRLSVQYSRYIKNFTRVQLPAHAVASEDLIGQINDYISAHKIDCVMAGDLDAQALLYELKPHLTNAECFPVSSGETLEWLHDKWRFHQLLTSHNLPSPPTVLLQEKGDVFREGVYALKFPVMAKPPGKQAGKGVVRANTIHDLADHVYGNYPYNRLPLLVQEYVPGLDAGLSLLAQDGRIVASLGQQYEPDGALTFFTDPEMLAASEKIVELTNYNGVAHIDCRRSIDGSLGAIVECNPRFWYSMPAAMAQGVNFVEMGIKLALSTEQQKTCATKFDEGPYYPLRAALKHVWRGGLPPQNLRELAREALDFKPHLYKFTKSLRGKRRV
jgi:predicted ATP-grasp superfamily ATP-dependent carboligase